MSLWAKGFPLDSRKVVQLPLIGGACNYGLDLRCIEGDGLGAPPAGHRNGEPAHKNRQMFLEFPFELREYRFIFRYRLIREQRAGCRFLLHINYPCTDIGIDIVLDRGNVHNKILAQR